MPATLVIDGHPNPDSLCAALAQSYADGNPGARLLALRELDFDIHMRHGYTRPMPIEPDLADARQAIRDAKHLVVVTPVWWRSVPALLKGFLDRALLPKEDYRYTAHGLPVGLLKGRSARILITADTPVALQRLMPDTRLASLTKGTIAFCGFKPVTVDRFAAVNKSTPEKRAKWLEQAKRYGEQDAVRVGAARALSSATA
ncbi:NAD(P)H-dependent oxidoreductase [Blastococcus sp. Marseille-P5729]|uniref:NAD(P)H-dependent oxidoreductase n=1 Tax=Blastococcus sp. Marseille-P5729 TaxID=2086582 RepID=UPI000D0FCEB4|nr:NAD(P)H-dependent oxidoreductase [Blastococcus sp. Marseille-P5729]